MSKQPDDIRFMFNLIAHRYNLMNSLITFGYDKYWRRTLLNQTRLPNNGRVLDIGTGTGDLSLKIVSDNTDIMCVGADFSENMLNVARARSNADSVCW
ncbi:MAG: class I SAM-dependent methyltransferase, partial [Chloroflexota bacterium]|nr:class I SAM-dependent methyltransferase [Chloroflexota bacterium]